MRTAEWVISHCCQYDSLCSMSNMSITALQYQTSPTSANLLIDLSQYKCCTCRKYNPKNLNWNLNHSCKQTSLVKASNLVQKVSTQMVLLASKRYSIRYMNKRWIERIWKEVGMAELIFHSGICLGGLSKITKTWVRTASVLLRFELNSSKLQIKSATTTPLHLAGSIL